MKVQLQRRTAVAVAAATVGVGTTGLLAGVAATGGHLLGFGSAHARASADGPRVVDRTRYEDERVLVGAPSSPVVVTAPDAAPSSSASRPSSARSAPAPSGAAPAWTDAPPVTTTTPTTPDRTHPAPTTTTAPGAITTTPTTIAPTTTEPPTTTVPPTTTTAPVSIPAQSRAVPLAQGTVNVTYTATTMTVGSIQPAAGWFVSDRSVSSTRATIQFQSSSTGRQVEWTIALRNGALAWSQG